MDLFLVSMLLMILLFIRVELVQAIRLAEIDRAARAARDLIDAGRGAEWRSAYAAYETGPDHYAMVFDLTRWTHNQFYPQGTKK